MHKFLGCDAGYGRLVHLDGFGHIVEHHGLHGFLAILKNLAVAARYS